MVLPNTSLRFCQTEPKAFLDRFLTTWVEGNKQKLYQGGTQWGKDVPAQGGNVYFGFKLTFFFYIQWKESKNVTKLV